MSFGNANKNKIYDNLEFVADNVDRNPNPDDEIKRLNKIGLGNMIMPYIKKHGYAGTVIDRD